MKKIKFARLKNEKKSLLTLWPNVTPNRYLSQTFLALEFG